MTAFRVRRVCRRERAARGCVGTGHRDSEAERASALENECVEMSSCTLKSGSSARRDVLPDFSSLVSVARWVHASSCLRCSPSYIIRGIACLYTNVNSTLARSRCRKRRAPVRTHADWLAPDTAREMPRKPFLRVSVPGHEPGLPKVIQEAERGLRDAVSQGQSGTPAAAVATKLCGTSKCSTAPSLPG